MDRLVDNSTTLNDIRATLFNGNADDFARQLREWISRFGVSSEDVKNLTLAALLARLLAAADEPKVQRTLQTALQFVKDQGWADRPASTIVASSTAITPA